jgi:hypothetical protein
MAFLTHGETKKEDCAAISVVFGIVVFLMVWILDIIYPPVLIAIPFGLIFGAIGLKSERKWLAITGIILTLSVIPKVLKLL